MVLETKRTSWNGTYHLCLVDGHKTYLRMSTPREKENEYHQFLTRLEIKKIKGRGT